VSTITLRVAFSKQWGIWIFCWFSEKASVTQT